MDSLCFSDQEFYSTSHGLNDKRSLNSSSNSLIDGIQNATKQAEELTSIEVDSNGDVVVGGWTYGDWFSQNQGGKDLLLMKYDCDLNLIWGWQYGKNDHDLINDLSIDIFDDIWIGGRTKSCLFSSNQGNQDGFITKIKSEGSLLFERQSEFSVSSGELINSISMNSRNNLIIGGYTEGNLFSSSCGNSDFFIVELGCDPGYINVETHCESTTFSPIFDPSSYLHMIPLSIQLLIQHKPSSTLINSLILLVFSGLKLTNHLILNSTIHLLLNLLFLGLIFLLPSTLHPINNKKIPSSFLHQELMGVEMREGDYL